VAASDEIEAVYRIVLEDDALVLKRLRLEPVRARPTIHDVFATPSWTLHFQRNSHNRVSGMILNSERVRNLELSRTGS
jgi:hypothetical protein